MSEAHPGMETIEAQSIRAQSYRLLSECYSPPDERLGERVRRFEGTAGEMYSLIEAVIPPDGALDDLRIDHAKLFVGPFRLLAPPYGSVYLENFKRVLGETTVEADAYYAGEGLKIVLKDMPDHIAVELEFMHFLVSKEAEALAGQAAEASLAYRRKQRDFMENHLGLWAPRFAALVVANAGTEFYSGVGEATASFVEQEMARLAGSFSGAPA